MGAHRHTMDRAWLTALIAAIPPARVCSQQAHSWLHCLRCCGAARRSSSVVQPGAGDVNNHIVNSTMTT